MTRVIPQKLYELSVIADDPRYEGFALDDSPSILGHDSLDDDITPGFADADSNSCWKQPSFHEKWVAPPVSGRVGIFNDYPGLDLVLPVFSKRACRVLAEFLEPNGELLPLRTDVGEEYFFYNITTIANALDHKRSKCEFWCDPPTTTTSIDYFAFHVEKLKGLSIFRLREWPIGVIVTDQFVRSVEQAGLNGFNFVKIWPFNPDENWRICGRRDGRHHTEKKDLKKQTLVLILPLEGTNPNSTEEQTIARLEDELDAQLVLRSLSVPYFGSYEGSDILNNEYRMFLTSPDVNKLEQKLRPWLERLDWPSVARAVKRYGGMYDHNAIEEVEYLNKNTP